MLSRPSALLPGNLGGLAWVHRHWGKTRKRGLIFVGIRQPDEPLVAQSGNNLRQFDCRISRLLPYYSAKREIGYLWRVN